MAKKANRIYKPPMMGDGPSPEEIAKACEQIQAGWSDAERHARCRWAAPQPVEMEMVSEADFGLITDFDRI